MNKKVLYLAIGSLIVLILGGGAYFWLFKTKPELKTGVFRVGDTFFNVEIADTMRSRTQGLSGRASLAENSGMLFVFPASFKYGFWMKDMNFPLDMVWIRDGKVVGVTADVPPPSGFLSLPSYFPPEAVDEVLEINAGTAAKLDIKAGDPAVLK